MTNPEFVNEDDLKEEEPVAPVNLRELLPPPALQNGSGKNFSASLAPTFQHDVNFVESAKYPQGSSVPTVALMPLPASTLSQVQGIVTNLIESGTVVPPPSGGGGGTGGGSVTLDVPNIFTPTDQTITPPGTLAIALAPEPIGTVFGVLSATQAAIGIDAFSIATGVTGTVATSCAPASPSGDWAFFVANGSNSSGSYISPTAPTGWAAFDATSALYIKQVPAGVAPISVSTPIAVAGTLPVWAAGMLLVGGTPVFVQAGSTSGGSGGFGSHISVTLTGVTAGNSILVLLLSADGGYAVSDRTAIPDFGNVADTGGNSYQRTFSAEGFVEVTTPSASSTLAITQAWLASKVASGSTTVTVQMTGKNAMGGILMRVIEISGITSVSPSLPTFLPPFSVEGPIDLSIQNTGGGVKNRLGLSNGGTNADLSGTGGANQAVFQPVLGGPLVVSTLDYPSLAGANPATIYNGNALTGPGLISELDSIDTTGRTADIGSTFFTGFSASIFYRISYYMIVTTVAGVSSVLPSLVLNWVDAANATSQSVTIAPASPTGNTLTTYLSGDFVLHQRGGNAMSYATSGYTSVGSPAMVFALYLRAEAL